MRTLVILCALCAIASADTPQDLYKQGRYAEAAEQFKNAYTTDPRPEFLFNAAQSYRLAKDCANAVAYYRKFLAVAPADTPNLDRVKSYITEMDACVKAAHAANLAEPAHPSEPAPRPPVDQPLAPVERTDTHDTGGSALPSVGIGVGVVGLAAVGAGVYFQHEVSVAEHDRAACTMATPCTLDQRKAIDDRGNRNETRAIASYSIGGAAIAAGVVLFVVGRHHAAAEHVAVSPLPGGAFATLGYAF